MGRTRYIIVAALAAALFASTTGVAQALVTISAVITGRGEQWRGYANDDYVIYAQYTRRAGSVAYAKAVAGGGRSRINQSGTGGVVGGFDPGTNRVLYQQFANRRSGLYFYNLDTQQRSRAAGVNSDDWEWAPLISSTFIVYARDHVRRGHWYTSLTVYNRISHASRTLGTWRWRQTQMYTGSAGDTYVAYTLCNSTCTAYVYDWNARTRTKIPMPDGTGQYAPTLDEANSEVYFTRSVANRCGRQVGIWRQPLPVSAGDTPTEIVDLPNGIDTGWESSLSLNSTSGETDLYLERYVCSTDTGDIYVAPSVSAA